MPVVKFQGDRISFPDSMSGDEISDVLGALWASTQAVGEFAAMIGTSSIAEPLAGIAGAGSALFSPSQGAGGRTVQSVRDALTYRPRTRAGQLAMQSIAKDVSHLSQATGAEHLSGYWKDRVVPALQENFGVISGSALAAVGLGLIGAFAEMSPGKILPVGGMRGAVGDLGDSGSPLFFHGTRQEFDEFDPDKAGEGHDFIDQGMFFHSNRDEAAFFAEKFDNDFNERIGGSPRVIETQHADTNPLEIDTPDNETTFFDSNADEIFADADIGDHDSIVVNGRDGTLKIMLDPSLIKIRSIETLQD